MSASPKQGEGIWALFRRYEIPRDSLYFNLFYELNSEILDRNNELKLNRTYLLPILRFKYDGNTIRSTLGMNYDSAKVIQDFNELLLRKGVRDKHYRDDLDLWALFYDLPQENRQEADEEAPAETSQESGGFEIFGEKYKDVKQIDNRLEGCVYYLVSGHGGPDPGAVGKRAGYELHEDEYAYDITLRLARRLLEHGAKVYVIIRDSTDGIRDDAYLSNSYDEFYWGGDTISRSQLERLKKRADIVNDLYGKNKSSAKRQELIVIHVDSRSYGKRIDVFFYHHPDSKEGKELAATLHKTIKEKYDIAQPYRGYQGTVSTRNLYMLHHTLPTCVFIELGNIRNPQDQLRFIKENNRQALANWLCGGLIKFAESK